MTPCPKCGRPVEAVPGEPVDFCTGCGCPITYRSKSEQTLLENSPKVNFCTWCGCPITSEAVRERITDLMLQGIRDDMRKAVERLEHDEPEKYGRLAAIIAGGSG
jgi:hypothetical protein